MYIQVNNQYSPRQIMNRLDNKIPSVPLSLAATGRFLRIPTCYLRILQLSRKTFYTLVCYGRSPSQPFLTKEKMLLRGRLLHAT